MSGCRGQMTQEYTDKMLYNQLLYFDTLFDIEKAKKKASEEDQGLPHESIFIYDRHCICIG